MSYDVNKVIEIALNEVGYLEKSASAYKKDKSVLDKKTEGAGSDNYTKYGRDMHQIYPSVMDFPAYWCDCFVDWCFYKAYGISTAKSLLAGDFNDYTVASSDMYKKKGAWHTSNPKKGDQIFFKNSVRICHTGLVYFVDSSYVYTVEGNTSGASGVVSNGGGVAKKKYSLKSSSIAGYGRPNYGTQTTASQPEKEEPSTDSTLNKTAKFSGMVNCGTLNVRTNAGANYAKVSFSPIKNNTIVDVCDSKKAANGATWYYIKLNGKYGFVHSDYVCKYNKDIVGTYKTTSGLKIRAGAGTDEDVVTIISKGGKVECTGYCEDVNGTKWYSVTYKTYKGFVSSKYLTK